MYKANSGKCLITAVNGVQRPLPVTNMVRIKVFLEDSRGYFSVQPYYKDVITVWLEKNY